MWKLSDLDDCNFNELKRGGALQKRWTKSAPKIVKTYNNLPAFRF